MAPYLPQETGQPCAGHKNTINDEEISMSQIKDEVLAANARYAGDFGDKGELPMPPGRRFTILTCMDARLDPAKYAGLSEGDAHVIRNAGGRASDDAIVITSYSIHYTKLYDRRHGRPSCRCSRTHPLP